MVVSPSIFAAVESQTETFGTMAIVLRGTTNGDPQATFFSVPFVPPVAAAGVVTAATGNTLQDTNARWTSGPFSGTNGPFYVELASGLTLNVLQSDALTRTLTVPGPVDGLITVGETYRIRQHLTLARLFGTETNSGLLAGLNANAADTVTLWSADTQQATDYFLSSHPSFKGWLKRNDFANSANEVVIHPAQGMIISRKTAGDATVYLHGQVKDTPLLVPIAPGYNLVGSLKSSQPLCLSELCFDGPDPNSLAPGPNHNVADNLVLMADDGKTLTYFYSDRVGNEGWYDSIKYAAATTVPVARGGAFFVLRKEPRSAFYWRTPTE